MFTAMPELKFLRVDPKASSDASRSFSACRVPSQGLHVKRLAGFLDQQKGLVGEFLSFKFGH